MHWTGGVEAMRVEVGWWGKSKVGSGLCGGVGTIEMQEAPHLQQSRSAERHK